ncbi:MAG: Uma2 family endonuclease [Pseudomonadota bacterium]
MAHAAPIKAPEMTVTEFLTWDSGDPGTKYELVDGVPRAMAPASRVHGTIQANLTGLLFEHLKGSRCQVLTEAGMVPSLKSDKNVRIPDVTVTCEAPNPDEKLVRNPKLIIQIISPSNERDTWESIWACASIPSLQEIIVVQSERVEVVVFPKDDEGHWPEHGTEFSIGSTAGLKTLDATLSVADIYDKTGLIEAEAQSL